jgi:hypothetical protein
VYRIKAEKALAKADEEGYKKYTAAADEIARNKTLPGLPTVQEPTQQPTAKWQGLHPEWRKPLSKVSESYQNMPWWQKVFPQTVVAKEAWKGIGKVIDIQDKPAQLRQQYEYLHQKEIARNLQLQKGATEEQITTTKVPLKYGKLGEISYEPATLSAVEEEFLIQYRIEPKNALGLVMKPGQALKDLYNKTTQMPQQIYGGAMSPLGVATTLTAGLGGTATGGRIALTGKEAKILKAGAEVLEEGYKLPTATQAALVGIKAARAALLPGEVIDIAFSLPFKGIAKGIAKIQYTRLMNKWGTISADLSNELVPIFNKVAAKTPLTEVEIAKVTTWDKQLGKALSKLEKAKVKLPVGDIVEPIQKAIDKNRVQLAGLVRRPALNADEQLLKSLLEAHGNWLNARVNEAIATRAWKPTLGAEEVTRVAAEAGKPKLLTTPEINAATQTMDNVVEAVESGKPITNIDDLIVQGTPDDVIKDIEGIISKEGITGEVAAKGETVVSEVAITKGVRPLGITTHTAKTKLNEFEKIGGKWYKLEYQGISPEPIYTLEADIKKNLYLNKIGRPIEVPKPVKSTATVVEGTAKEPWQMTNYEFRTSKMEGLTEAQKLKWTQPEKVSGVKINVQNQWDDEHKVIVQQALSEGKSVPPEVLKDYPELDVKAIDKQLTTSEIAKGIVPTEPVPGGEATVEPPLKITEPMPEGKPSKIAKSIEAKAVEAKLTTGFSDLAEYTPIIIAEQAQKATNLINSDLTQARRIIRGEEELSGGLRGTSLITAMEEYILKHPDADLAYELANSPIVSGTSAAAQELRLAAERTPDSVTAKLQEIRRVREAKIPALKLKKTIATKNLKASVEKINLSKEELSWNRFLDKITC